MASRRPHIILLLLIVATLGAVFLFASPGSPLYKSPALGLDLQGGLQVVLQARPENGRKVTPEDMTRSVDIMRRRVDKLGVSETDIRTQGKDQIVIDLPGVSDTARAMKVIGKTAQLQIYDLEAALVRPISVSNYQPQPHAALYPLLKAVQAQVKVQGASSYYLFNAKHKLVVGPIDAQKELQKELLRSLAALSAPRKLLKSDILLAVPKKMTVVSCDKATSRVCPGPGQIFEPKAGQTFYYLFNLPPALTGGDLNASGIRADFGSNGGPIVDLSFTSSGNKAFHRITKAEWDRGHIYGTQHNAIVLDGQLITFPQIDPNDQSLSEGIDPSVTGAIIEGIGSIGEAKDIATVLQTGALPVKFDTKASTSISATLGKDSLHQALVAAIAGLLLVVVFLLALYRFLGLVAVIGLGIYAAFLYGVILLFNVTLSLPGFAGMILTIGVAADANVVVFERIKEESRAGKSVKAAVATGYARGFHTILDANVVTFITAAVLFLVATAGVKGFALMLMLGTGISLITAVAGTRAMLGLLSNFRWFGNPSFMGASGAQSLRWLNIDFMRKRYLWLAISGMVVLVSAVSLGAKGLNLGIDFKGGTQIEFATPRPAQLSTVRSIVGAVTGEKNAQIQGLKKSVGSESYKDFQIRIRSPKTAVLDNLTSQLESKLNASISSKETVSNSFSGEIARSAILAIIVSFLLITGYMTMRFDIKFAVPVILAVLHDIVITVGVYALTAREVTTSTVAAVLTVLGYSIYDTIIIFDRIRENVPLMRQAPFARIVNVSIWETIRRSLATTFITLLPVGALFIAGGSTLKDFAFALLVGITSGAYSSIFVAAPLLTIWKEREPEYVRRLQGAGYRGGRDESVGGSVPQPALAAAAEKPSVYGKYEGEAVEKRERRRQRRRSRPHGRPR
ncbi:MAG: protein translocase subunit SecD [Gaiellaceae bacterium]